MDNTKDSLHRNLLKVRVEGRLNLVVQRISFLFQHAGDMRIFDNEDILAALELSDQFFDKLQQLCLQQMESSSCEEGEGFQEEVYDCYPPMPSTVFSETEDELYKKRYVVKGAQDAEEAAKPKTILQEYVEEFDRDHVTIGDFTVPELEYNFGGSTYRARKLFDWLQSVWTSSARIGTLYLKRDTDGVLTLELPLRIGATEEEFEEIRKNLKEA